MHYQTYNDTADRMAGRNSKGVAVYCQKSNSECYRLLIGHTGLRKEEDHMQKISGETPLF